MADTKGKRPARAFLLLLASLLLAVACATGPDEYFARGRRSLEAGQLAAASRNFHRCIERDPARGDAYLALGRIYFREEKWSTAANAFRRAARLDERLAAKIEPLLIDALYRDAVYEVRLGKERAAIASFAALFERVPGYPGLRDTYAALLLRYGRSAVLENDYVGGVGALKEALRVDPENETARKLLEQMRFAVD